MKKLFFLISILVLGYYIVASCVHEADISDIKPVCFQQDILPLINANCTRSGCHDGAGGEERFSLRTYGEIRKYVVPYNSLKSQLYKAITDEWGNLMPPGNPLSTEQRTLIRLWIDQGAPDNECSDTSGTTPGSPDTVCFNTNVLPILLSSCAISGCHDAISHKEGLVMDSWQNLMNGNIIVPGDSLKGDFIKKIRSNNPDERMPPPPMAPLTSLQIHTLSRWIADGALNSVCTDVGCDTTNVTFSGTIFPSVQKYCYGCHSGGSPSGGILLTGYSSISARIADGRLPGAIRRQQGYAPMPPSGPLPNCELRKWEIWIMNGYPDN
ncbi:MAG: c-type cytochrome domain-containing protein [Bacteroidales bacterium]